MKIKSKKESSSGKKTAKREPRLYEAMFLIDSAEATADWEGVNSTIKKILEKAGVEIVSLRKWDDRRLAYEIGGKEKGTYVLCYFKAEGGKIREIERDVRLSEQVMRVLILCAEIQGMENAEEGPASKKESETKAQDDSLLEETKQQDDPLEKADEKSSEA